jgi:hypothetical protein
MFGMLDYRAYQLYRLLFFIPNTILHFVGLLGLPLGAYALALYFYRDYFAIQIDWYWFFLFAVIAYFVVSAILTIVFLIINKLFCGFFSIIIDVMPHDGRTETEAEFVLKYGKGGVHQLLMDATDPKDWTDEMMQKSVYYSANSRQRLYAIHEQCLYHDGDKVSVDNIKTLLRSEDLEQDWLEWVVTNPALRTTTLQGFLYIYLILANPWI